MIISKISSGLGNQLFQYSIGRQLSLLKNAPLKLDISFFETQNLRNYRLDNYNIEGGVATEEEILSFTNIYRERSLKAFIKRKIQNSAAKHKKPLFYEKEWWNYEPSLLKAGPNVYIRGYWQHYKYFENLNPSIFSELKLKESLEADIINLVAEINNNTSSISVHIRRGDYVSNSANHLMNILPKEYYLKGFSFLKRKIKNPVFYFFSDDLNWVKDNFKMDAPSIFVDAQKDYLELDIMSKCSHNIIANSTFSWWAAFLNQNPKKIVVSPKHWVANLEINKRVEIQFPTWIKI